MDHPPDAGLADIRVDPVIEDVEPLADSGVPVQHRRPDEGASAIACVTQQLCNRGRLCGVVSLPGQPNPVVGRVGPGQHRDVGGEREDRGGPRLVVDRHPLAPALEQRRRHALVAIDPQAGGAGRIPDHQHQVGGVRRRLLPRATLIFRCREVHQAKEDAADPEERDDPESLQAGELPQHHSGPQRERQAARRGEERLRREQRFHAGPHGDEGVQPEMRDHRSPHQHKTDEHGVAALAPLRARPKAADHQPRHVGGDQHERPEHGPQHPRRGEEPARCLPVPEGEAARRAVDTREEEGQASNGEDDESHVVRMIPRERPAGMELGPRSGRCSD